MDGFMWNGPICDLCSGSGAILHVKNGKQEAAVCPKCKGCKLGEIGHGYAIKLSDRTERLGSR